MEDYTKPNARSPRQNFDSFMEGFVTVFIVLIGEDWQIIMHDFVRAKKDHRLPCIFFISLMVIGNLFLMNLFLAILLKNFEDKKQLGSHEENENADDCEHHNAGGGSLMGNMTLKFRRAFLKKDKTAPIEVME